VLGDTTEGALLVVAAKAGLDLEAEEAAAPRVTEFPFDSDRKLMTTVHKSGADYQACAKGAPAELLARCTEVEWDGRRGPLIEQDRAAVLAASDALAAQGLRVLAVARRQLATARRWLSPPDPLRRRLTGRAEAEALHQPGKALGTQPERDGKGRIRREGLAAGAGVMDEAGDAAATDDAATTEEPAAADAPATEDAAATDAPADAAPEEGTAE
jgi:hypothetical protein